MATTTADAKDIQHQHAKAGGGTLTHSHPFDPGDEHGHDGLLPLPEAAGKKAAMAELSSKQRQNLSASDFAWTDSDGTGHMPIHDASHVRNALARFTQTSFPDDATKKKAAAKIRSAAKKFGIDVGDDSPVAKLSEGRSALIAFHGSEVDLSEHRLPYLVTGTWEFPEYGRIDIGPSELLSVVQHFRTNVRGQDLPLCDVDHVDPIYRGLACGWVRDLVPDDPERPSKVEAVVDLNEVGDQLVQQDRVRYTSPTLLRDWTDPATGVTYPYVAAGVDVRTRDEHGGSALAMTNFPKLKQLGRIACAEDGTARAAVLAMGEPRATTPAKAARLLMQEDAADDPDSDGDDDGPVPPCIYQPGMPGSPNCPGFTRWPGDDDGDGTCLLATKGCNGYRSVPDGMGTVTTISSPQPWAFSEGQGMPDSPAGGSPAPSTGQPQVPQQPAQPQPPANPTPQPQTPPQAPPGQPAAPQQPTQSAADAAESNVIRAAEVSALRQRIEAADGRATAAEARLQAAEAEIKAMRMAERVGAIGDRLQACLRTGRIDKAEYDRLSAPERIAAFAEGDAVSWVLESIEARPASSAVPLGERGSGSTQAPDSTGAAQALVAKANEIVAEAAKAGRTMNFAEAAKQAARQMPAAAAVAHESGYGGR